MTVSTEAPLAPITSQVTMKKRLITPPLAERLLAAGDGKNRHVRPLWVTQLARDMEQGDWVDTGEPLRVDVNGVTTDGQHRLLALIAANAQIEMWVASNVPVAAHKNIDTGRIRTAGDELHYRSEVRVTHLAATCNNVWRYDQDNPLTKLRPTRAQLIDVLEANPGIRKYLPLAAHRSHVVSKSPLAAIAYLISRDVNDEEADGWLERVGRDTNQVDGDPCLALRRFALNQKRSGLYVTPTDWMAVCIKSFNYFVQGREIQSIRWRRGGTSPEAFPRILNPYLTPSTP